VRTAVVFRSEASLRASAPYLEPLLASATDAEEGGGTLSSYILAAGEPLLIMATPDTLSKVLLARRLVRVRNPVGLLASPADLLSAGDGVLQELSLLMLSFRDVDELLSMRRSLKPLATLGEDGLRAYAVVKVAGRLDTHDLMLIHTIASGAGITPVVFIPDGVPAGDSLSKDLERALRQFRRVSVGRCVTRWLGMRVEILLNLEDSSPLYALITRGSVSPTLIELDDCLVLTCDCGHDRIGRALSELMARVSPVLNVGGVHVDEEFLSILDSLVRTGCIKRTCEELGIPYHSVRGVLEQFKELGNVVGVKLVTIKRGGVERGGISFTEAGLSVLNYLKYMYTEVLMHYREVVTAEALLKGGDRACINSLGGRCSFPLP